MTPTSSARFDVAKLGSALEAIHDRLSGVVIERLPYTELIRRYDRPGTLTYLDPPYWGCEEDYGEGVFDRTDCERLAEILQQLQGRFLLSLNDTPGVQEVFRGFHFEEVGVAYSVGQHAGRPKAREVLISGS